MFKKLLGRDAEADLDRADRWFERGDPVGALKLAQRHLEDKDPRIRERAQALADDSRRAALESILEKVDVAVAVGDREEALEWLEAALTYVSDPEHRRRLEERRTELSRLVLKLLDHGVDEESEPLSLDQEFDSDELYGHLIDRLTEDFRPLYSDRDPGFREAYLALYRLDIERALELYDQLLAKDPRDPVLLFERGRTLMVGGQVRKAREDLESAWEHFGERHIYSAEPEGQTGASMRLPSLWAEACLEDDPGVILKRFGGRAAAGDLEPDLIQSYVLALREVGRTSEAAELLSRTIEERFPSDRWLYLAWAGCLAALGDVDPAIRVLERAMNLHLIIPESILHEVVYGLLCLKLGMQWEGPKHNDDKRWLDVIPASRRQPSPLETDRVEELFRMLRSLLSDPLPPSFHFLEARFRELRGDETGAAEARALAASRKGELEAMREMG